MVCETTFGNSQGAAIKSNKIKKPSVLVFITENISDRSDALFTTSNYTARLWYPHNSRVNMLMSDAHVESAALNKISQGLFTN
jgi:prepilin-type processing-associated H-X9-DG protein